jgi:capsular exopolysaccharide synthesis family protein
VSRRLLGGPRAVVSPYARAHEPFRMLRLSFELSRSDDGPATVCFTSSGAGEGKSTLAANFAVAAAHAGRSVLLVDADVRRPSIHTFFGLPMGPGLMDTLARSDAGEIRWIRPVASQDRLMILTAGATALAGDVIASPRMETMLQSLRPEFELIVIDTPPVLLAAETLGITTFDGVSTILVATPTTRRRALRHAVHKLELTGATVAGLVLNKDGRLSSYGVY